MVNIEIALIVAFGVFNAVLIALFSRMTMKTVLNGLEILDMRLSEAITSLISETLENFKPEMEPMNPIVGIFAEHLRNQMNPKIIAKDISRDEGGKFQEDNA